MTAAGMTLKSLYPKLFHVTCVAYLLHNSAMKIKSHFEDVDQLIAKIKAIAIKNKPDWQNSLLLVTHPRCYDKMGERVTYCLVLRKKFA